MAILPILQFPSPLLKITAKPVDNFNQELEKIVTDMFETMYSEQGLGLAATQVNIDKRILVLDISDNGTSPLTVINPKISGAEGSLTWEEGCLSFPGVYAKVKRSASIDIEYQDIKGNMQTLHANELTAICIQHEIDHLNGITFYDHLSNLKKSMIRRKLSKLSAKAE